MYIQYVANDGRVFSDIDDCKDYDAKLSFVMYTYDGGITTCIDDTIGICFFNKIGIDYFFEKLKADDYDPEELTFREIRESQNEGLYLWDDWTEKFCYIDPDRYESYKKILDRVSQTKEEYE